MSRYEGERESAGAGDQSVSPKPLEPTRAKMPPSGYAGSAVAAYLNASEPVTLVIVSADAVWQRRLREASLSRGILPAVCASASRAAEHLREHERAGDTSVAVVAVDVSLGEQAVIEAVRAARGADAGVLMLCGAMDAKVAGLAMRCGAMDVMDTSLGDAPLGERVWAGATRAREQARHNRRSTRLKRICRRVCDAPRHVARQMDAIWADLMNTPREIGRHMNQVAISSEFGGLIKQELDLEVLLRTTLEYILSKSGPTNAAVFLPATSGDFTLGAYVNYDCPKETVDVLLDHMANVVAPRFEDLTDVTHLTNRQEIEEKVTGDAMWIGDSHIVAFACRHEGECLAIFLFFRDARSSYSEAFVDQLRVMRDLFGAQLARVVRIHHRHLPKEKWGALGDPPREENDEGMAM